MRASRLFLSLSTASSSFLTREAILIRKSMALFEGFGCFHPGDSHEHHGKDAQRDAAGNDDGRDVPGQEEGLEQGDVVAGRDENAPTGEAQVLISKGLKPEEKIVIAGVYQLVEGENVKDIEK